MSPSSHRRRPRRVLGALAVAAALAAAPIALAAPAPVTITMGKGGDFQTSVSPASAKAGAIRFTLVNRGSMTHEAVIIRTATRFDRLPVKDSRASEKGRIGAIKRVAGGTRKALTLTLAAGKYVIICNVPGHYQAGMRAAFTVRR
jgi:uncharacterized cupredoxin-like copper-binding protein